MTTLLGMGMFATVQAQQGLTKNAIGLRFSDGDYHSFEFNYQRLLGSNNRLELGLGFRSSDNIDAYKLTGVYQWVWNIDGGFNWYAGIGGALGTWRIGDRDDRDDSGAIVAITPQLGIEYNLNIPLQVFVDFRPDFNLTDYRRTNTFSPQVGIGARFKFN